MATDYWIKLYNEILNDPKMALLPDRIWRRTIELFLVASQIGGNDRSGNLPSTGRIAWYLRMTADELEPDLIEIARTGIINRTDTGWLIVNFQKRQKALSGAERMKMSRERQHKQEYYGDETSQDGVTNSNTELEIDKEIDKEKNPPTPPPAQKRPNIFKLYENVVGLVTQPMSEKLKQAEKDYPQDWIEWAFQQADNNNKRSWSYVEACLKNRKDGGSYGPRPAKNGNGSKPARPLPPGADDDDYVDLENIRLNPNDEMQEARERLHEKGITDAHIIAYCKK